MATRFHISSLVRSLVTGWPPGPTPCSRGWWEAVPSISISWTPWKGIVRVSMPTTALAPQRIASSTMRCRQRWRVRLKTSLNSLISPRAMLLRLPMMPPAAPTE